MARDIKPTLQLKILVKMVVLFRDLNWRLFFLALDEVLSNEEKKDWGLETHRTADGARYTKVYHQRRIYGGDYFSWSPKHRHDGSSCIEEFVHRDGGRTRLPSYRFNSADLSLLERIEAEYRFQELKYACQCAMHSYRERFDSRQAVVLTIKRDVNGDVHPPTVVLTNSAVSREWVYDLDTPDISHAYGQIVSAVRGLVFYTSQNTLPGLHVRLKAEVAETLANTLKKKRKKG